MSYLVLVTSQVFIQEIPGGLMLLSILRYLLIASLALYFVPIFFYMMLFRKGNILCEVLLGYVPFLFFTPTYLNILNSYSLCRIDDISWGTKGLDSGSGRNADLMHNWRQIKFVHVGKYVIWNVILATVLLTLGSSYATRFFVTLVMVGLITSTLIIKVVVGLGYMFSYRFKTCCFEKKKPSLRSTSRITAEINRHAG
jgi:chitin synthase